jgi:(p)ppGpp synthase/HD superfamily hydrolase
LREQSGHSTLKQGQISNLKLQRIKVAKLEDTILLAAQAHRGQKDKAGAPYILHPLRMMLRMDTEEEMMVAVLHDVIEDSLYTLSDLEQAGYPRAVLEAVDCLTRQQDESYDEFIERIKPNPLARRVKLADLEDNMNLTRLPNPQEKDLERLEKYRRAWSTLTDAK